MITDSSDRSSARLPRFASRVLLALATAVWIATVLFGFPALWNYKTTPGESGRAASVWPKDSGLARDENLSTVVMVAHPRCPCTRASLAELEQIMNAARGAARAYVLFLKPSEVAGSWTETDTWRAAQRIAGVTSVLDVDGRYADRFGVRTSGHTLLYGRNAKLLFSGGITFARGHQGANSGTAALVSLLKYGHAPSTINQVFGCSLVSLEEPRKGDRT